MMWQASGHGMAGWATHRAGSAPRLAWDHVGMGRRDAPLRDSRRIRPGIGHVCQAETLPRNAPLRSPTQKQHATDVTSYNLESYYSPLHAIVYG